MLSSNSPGGVAQFFDRDFPAEMAAIGIEGLQEFMVIPGNLEDILQRLEAARKSIYFPILRVRATGFQPVCFS